MKIEPTVVTLRIVLAKPTAGVDFGLQEGHGSNYQVVSRQRSTGHDLEFEFTVTARTSRKGDQPDFAGSFVQGPAGGRFVYINIGTYAGQMNTPWSRRLKILSTESPGICCVRVKFWEPTFQGAARMVGRVALTNGASVSTHHGNGIWKVNPRSNPLFLC